MGNAHVGEATAQSCGASRARACGTGTELVKSLDAPGDSDAADAWDSEILRRLSEIEAGTARLVDRDELRRRMPDEVEEAGGGGLEMR